MSEQQSPSVSQPCFQLHEVVWAKITGFPWWPARITALPDPTSPLYRVDFFADTTHAYVSPCKLSAYQPMRHHPAMLRQIKKTLRRAVAIADQFFERFLGTHAGQKSLLPRVEAHSGLQKILSQDVTSTRLQEIKENAENREEMVRELLRRYNLHELEEVQPVERRGRGCRRGVRRSKVKKICKAVEKEKGEDAVQVEHLLARRLKQLLTSKDGLNGQQRRNISLSLAKQVHHTNQQHSIDSLTRLLTWLSISPSSTILCYFQSWSSLHSDKDKGSDLTCYE